MSSIFEHRLIGEHWDAMRRFLVIDTIDNKWKDHLYAMEVLKTGIGLRGYAQVDPKNEYKKEGFEKFQMLKREVADHVTGFVWKKEATDTIRDMITGKLRREAPQPQQPPMPRTPEELQALFEQLIAAGKIPQELLDAALALFVEKGFAATRSEEVAQRAGVSKGTLYLYFPSKEELLKFQTNII